MSNYEVKKLSKPIHDVSPLDSVIPPIPFSSLGTKVAEKASEIPITM